MKRILFVILIGLSSSSWACDGCNISTGLVNSDPFNYVSFKLKSVTYDGIEIPFFRHSGHGGSFTENYLNYDLIAKYFLTDNFYTQTLISFQQTGLQSATESSSFEGLIDPMLIVGYQNTEIFESWMLSYNVFGGLDFGVGKYVGGMNTEYSPGSKSYDGIIGTEFLGRFNKVGVLAKGNYKLNTNNPDDYRFGSVINSGLSLIYYHEKERMMYVPYIGITYEWDMKDESKSSDVINSSSEVLFLDAGVNFLFNNKLLLGGKYQYGVMKNVPGWESLDVSGFEIEVSYIFGK